MNGHARYIIGDVFTELAKLPDNSVDLVLTSPPFLGLRSYLPEGDPNKTMEVGSEATPAAFIDVLLALAAECRRVLAPHGSLCVELGDTYSGSGGAGGDYKAGGLREGQPIYPRRKAEDGYDGGEGTKRYVGSKYRGVGADGHNRTTEGDDGFMPIKGGKNWPLPKSLCGIPQLFPLSLAYGRNLLTGNESPAGRWRVRNVVAWCRPNPPVGALGDKFRPATSYMTMACVSSTRYFDLDAVRATPVTDLPLTLLPRARGSDDRSFRFAERINANPGGAPPLDHWVIPTSPFQGAHFATWPPELCTRPVLAMCPQWVCQECGEPRRRVRKENPAYEGRAGGPTHNNAQQGKSLQGFSHAAYPTPRWLPNDEWTDCGHKANRRGVVLDPFAGSGTTLAVATGHGRDAIGIDIDPRNALLAERRVGMLLTVEV